jgi:predicted transcriptional regulator
MDESFAKLMGGMARLKLLRLFFFNPTEVFDRDSIAVRLKISRTTVGKEVAFLARTGLIRKRLMYKDTQKVVRGKVVKKKVQGFMLSQDFPHFTSLRQFMIDTAMPQGKEVASRLRSAGRLRLVITSGVFMQMWDSRIDILIVGEEINPDILASAIKNMEAELGHELKYAAFTTQDFYYRRSVQDKLVRDVIDYPHEKVIDRIGL